MVIQDGLNYLTFTLTEKVTLTNPGFVLVIKNDSTNKQVACKLVTDISSYPDRYNRYAVTMEASPTPLTGEIYLEHHGWHKYYVYETLTPDTFDYAGVDNLDLSTLTGLVEHGKIKHQKPEVEIESYINRATSIKAYVS